MPVSQGYTLADLQRMRGEMDMQWRFHQVEEENRLRKELGDTVYEFMQRGSKQYE